MSGMENMIGVKPRVAGSWEDHDRESQDWFVTGQFYNGSGADIADGQLVTTDLTDTDRLGHAIEPCDTADDPLVVGFTVGVIKDGTSGTVMRRGIHLSANVLTGVTAGTALQTSATSGRAVSATDTERNIGVVLTTAVANVAAVRVDCC